MWSRGGHFPEVGRMKRVGIREFRDHATRYLAGGEVLAVERHGRPVGFYIPVAPSPDEETRHAVERLGQVVERILATSGMTEDELADALDLSRPFTLESAESVGTGHAVSG